MFANQHTELGQLKVGELGKSLNVWLKDIKTDVRVPTHLTIFLKENFK